jgi:hypothetical protein
LTVLENVGGNRALVKCSCGVEKEVSIRALKAGATASCGCIFIEQLKSRHAAKRLDAEVAARFGTPEEFAARLGRARNG